MAASFCSLPAGVAGHRSRSASSKSLLGQRTLRTASGQRPWQREATVPALFAAVLLLVAVIAAPERPGDQAAICQRHNGVDACRVW
jgi:hypothetical protein